MKETNDVVVTVKCCVVWPPLTSIVAAKQLALSLPLLSFALSSCCRYSPLLLCFCIVVVLVWPMARQRARHIEWRGNQWDYRDTVNQS